MSMSEHPIDFVFCLHNHQPVGNFDHVFEDLYQKSYFPTLKVIEKFPNITVCLHYSGSLLDWLEANHPDYLETLFELIERGTVSPVLGGYYEPVLALIPTEDAIAQIERMKDFYQRHVGFVPRSFWPAERVFDDSLIPILGKCGIEHVLVDDQHLFLGGVTPPENGPFGGYYLTDKGGYAMNLFPSAKALRYLIPYADVDEISHKVQSWLLTGQRLMTYGDDGEKFGGWPGTFDRVFREGWLERFFHFLSTHTNHIRAVTFEQAAKNHRPVSRVYLPPGSYEEMMEWCLDAKDQVAYRKFKHVLESQNLFDRNQPFLKGGIFLNFLKKYPESNHFHKMMQYLSHHLNEWAPRYSEDVVRRARGHLYKAQSNCPYWHGLFGGVYLSHLRDSVWENLTRVQNELFPEPTYSKLDYNFDQVEEVIFHTGEWHGVVQAGAEGALTALCPRRPATNLFNTFGRRVEAYHLEALEADQTHDAQTLNIHNKTRYIEPGQRKLVLNDGHPRHTFVDYFSDQPLDAQDINPHQYALQYKMSSFSELETHYCLKLENDSGITKTYQLMKWMPKIIVKYQLGKEASLPHPLFVEINVTLLSPHSPDRILMVNGKKHYMDYQGMEQNTSQFSIQDDVRRILTNFIYSSPVSLFYYPCVTLSASESGLEANYQHTCCIFQPSTDQLKNGFEVEIQRPGKGAF